MTDVARAVADQYGNVEMVVTVDEGKVIQRFRRPMAFIVYEPQNCLDVCEAMVAAAYEAKGEKPVGPALKASLVEAHRNKLVPRITLMLANLRQDKLKTDGYIALQIVDTVFSEIFS